MDEQLSAKPLRAWREARQLTQFQLAARAGVSLSTVTGVEAKRHDIGILAARKLAAVLSVRVDEIAWPEADEIEAARQRRRSKSAA